MGPTPEPPPAGPPGPKAPDAFAAAATRPLASDSGRRATAFSAPSLVRVGKYLVERELGRGGMGVVYRARHPELQAQVAIKVLLAGEHASAQAIARFEREAQAVARLRHPGIVHVHDFGTDGAHTFLVMDLVEGDSLDMLLAAARTPAGGLPPATAVSWLAEIADAVQAAHEAGVIHRDLKPCNVMRERASGRLRVADFGLARVSADAGPTLTQSGSVLGTPAYMSPEQAAGQLELVDERSDVYQLGVTLYELLTGRLPFSGGDIAALLLRIQDGSPPSVRERSPRVDRDIETICLKAMARERERRYPSARALAEDCRRYLAGEPIHARAASAGYRLRKFLVRRRQAVTAGVLVLALALAAAAVAWFQQAQIDTARLYLPLERELDVLRLRFYQPEFRLTEAEFAKYEEVQKRVREQMARSGESAQGWLLVARCREICEDLHGAEEAFAVAHRLDPHDRSTLIRHGLFEIRLAVAAHNETLGTEAAHHASHGRAVEAVRWIREAQGTGGEVTLELRLAEAWQRLLERGPRERYTAAADLQRWGSEPFVEEFLLVEAMDHPDEERVRTAEKAIARMPGYAAAYAVRGIGREKTDPAAALADLDHALAIHPRLRLAHVWRAWMRHRRGDHPGAREDAEALLAADRRDPRAWYVRAMAREWLDDRTGALADYAKAIELDPTFAEAHVNRAVIFYESGGVPAAVAESTRAIGIMPELAEAWGNRGVQRMALGDRTGAMADLDHCLELAPNDGRYLRARGLARGQAGDPAGAEADFDRLIEVWPRWAQGRVDRAVARLNRGEVAGARADLDAAIALDDRLGAAWLNRGVARELANDVQGARADFDRAVELEPDVAIAHYHRARMLSAAQDAPAAIAEYSRALELDPALADAYGNRGFLYHRAVRRDEAIADYRKALEVAPPDWPFREKIQQLLKAAEDAAGR